MARQLRHFEPNSLIEVTMRTLQALLLLRPSPEVYSTVLGVLGRTQRIYGLRIHAFVFLSNHYHLLCSPRDPQHLARAMCYINSNLARELGKLHGFREKFWARRYQAILVSGEPSAQLARFRYLLSHGCKEGFVLTPGDWPGVHCVHALLEGRVLEGVWYDRTKEFAARRRGIAFEPSEFSTTYQVELTPLPCLSHLTVEQQRQCVAGLIAEIEDETRARVAATGREPLGPEFVRRQNPLGKPLRSKKSCAPICHAASRAVRRALRDARRRFVAAYRTAAARLRGGDLTVEFPPYCFPPPRPFAAGLAPPLPS